MHKHHPDVLSENSDTDMARKLNEAFELIKREGLSSIIKVVDWGISENAGAYCKRKLYMEDNLFGDDIIVDTGAYGKYYWEPDMESFGMLLKSVGEAVNELLDISPVSEETQRRSTTIIKAKLLHLLIQEFIDPFECIRILCPYEEKEGSEMQIFRIKCRVNYPNLRFA
jgi:hypothetical protein